MFTQYTIPSTLEIILKLPVCSQHLQAITEAVNNGGSLSATRRAGYVGSSGSWAVTQGNRVFNVVDWQNTWGGKRKQ